MANPPPRAEANIVYYFAQYSMSDEYKFLYMKHLFTLLMQMIGVNVCLRVPDRELSLSTKVMSRTPGANLTGITPVPGTSY